MAGQGNNTTSQALALTNKLLTSLKDPNQRELIEFLVRHGELAIEQFSRYYPLSYDLVERYKDKWNLGCWGLSGNGSLPWTETLIEQYKDKWEWERLSGNGSLPWSEMLIERYKDKWDWGELSDNESLPWSEVLIERYKD